MLRGFQKEKQAVFSFDLDMSEMKTSGLTTIITSYNTGNYICDAIDSVMSQLPQTSECIVVDDGSTDDSEKTLAAYENKYPNLHIYFCPHRGVSAARNFGISKAACEYISFLDGDDVLLPGFFEKSRVFIEKEYDLYIFSIENEIINRNEVQTAIWSVEDNVYQSVGEFADAYIRKGNLLFYSNCNKVYRRDIIMENELKFEEDLSFGEDRIFNYDYLHHCNSILTSGICKFRYIHRNPESLSSKFIPDYPLVVKELHKRKTDCFFALAQASTLEEKAGFADTDYFWEYMNALKHLEQHQKALTAIEVKQYRRKLSEMKTVSLQKKLRKYNGHLGKHMMWLKKKIYRLIQKIKRIDYTRKYFHCSRVKAVLTSLKSELFAGIVQGDTNVLSYAWFSPVRARKTIQSYEEYVYFSEHINEQDKIYLLRDKHLTLQRFGADLKRKWLYVPEESEEEIISFLRSTPRFILKPNAFAGGKGIAVGSIEKGKVFLKYSGNSVELELSECYEHFRREDGLLEEYIEQHPDLSAVYPDCVNTIRIHTLNVHNFVEVVELSSIRFGSGKGSITNMSNSVTIGITESGRLYEHDCYAGGTYHPDSKIPFGSVVIPFWEECVALAKKSALLFPEINYIGWDIAVTPEGPVVVEGNGAPLSYTIEELYNLRYKGFGLREFKKQQLENTLFRKALTKSRIQEINQKIFYCSEPEKWPEADIVVVLGSTCCEYRIKRAAELFFDKDVFFVVSGKNRSAYTNSDGAFYSEADYMEHYLLEHGVKQLRIWKETKATSTKENLEHVFSLLEEKGVEKDKKVAIITGGFHMARVRKLLKETMPNEKYEVIFIPAYGEHTKPDNWYQTNMGTGFIRKERDSLS